jgi:hypothetical protein
MFFLHIDQQYRNSASLKGKRIQLIPANKVNRIWMRTIMTPAGLYIVIQLILQEDQGFIDHPGAEPSYTLRSLRNQVMPGDLEGCKPSKIPHFPAGCGGKAAAASGNDAILGRLRRPQTPTTFYL